MTFAEAKRLSDHPRSPRHSFPPLL